MEESSDKLLGVQGMDNTTRETAGYAISKADTDNDANRERVGESGVQITQAQIESTLSRVANISVGLSWSSNLSVDRAAMMASHTISVELCRLGINFEGEAMRISSHYIIKGLCMYYDGKGNPYAEPAGKPEVKFKKSS